MVDESGSEDSRYYLVTLVFHDQMDDIATPISLYEASLRKKGLLDVPMHDSPLMNGHGDYEGLTLEQRKRMLSAFFVMFQHTTCCALSSSPRLSSRGTNRLLPMKRSLERTADSRSFT